MEPKRLRWGIVSAARIADSLVQAVRSSPNCDLAAVASRNIEQAQAWAAARDVPLAFGSYDAVIEAAHVAGIAMVFTHKRHFRH